MEIKVKTTRFTTNIYWEKSGKVTATLQIENGKIHKVSREGVAIERAEAVGEILLQTLKEVFI